ncbi:Na+/H+ antiporter NhaC family protein [Pseudogracilibacillus auburnensis]|uniref:Na+/H+ antiporter NhaC n=1 Tax=Pseudogracilibacillus auburnensis TaxID=1494959 RepID=A0A2V3W2R4_9BACI|nr:Na+/H+ antiporter NhaC family protein [Pseudogracilibacillus auburnensis]PXW88587.1 Na+/H+ antiporter NhaC [Pseudogracilibacillus auburnensis]
MVETAWSLLPPIFAIVLVLLTRRVLLSLGVGIIAAALFITNYHMIDSILLIWEAYKGVFVADGSLNTWNIYILLFVLMLGIITAFVHLLGGTKAFGEWIIRRVKTRVGAQLMTMTLGIVVFLDDYFNSLTVGQIARPVTDQHRVSRAKLAYIVDSTAAPICVIAPISSWGAYIIGLIGSVFVTHNITTQSELVGFLKIIPMNFYVWAALGTMFVIIISKVDFGAMRMHEQHAIKTGEVIKHQLKEIDSHDTNQHESKVGKMSDLVIPIAALFIATIGLMYWTGSQSVTESKNLITIFGEADVSKSLLYGGIVGTITTFLLFIRHFKQGEVEKSHFVKSVITGAKSMLPAFAILIFAWAISDLIGQLGTGLYLAELVHQSNLHFWFLPFIVFLMAGFIAFATGTSWGSFALLMPIAGQIAAATEIDLLLPMLAAVLAGAVFGDHCSPISDTTILSSTGSSCHHIDHVTTQLPYALVSAGIAGIGYLVFGFTGSVLLGLAIVGISLVGLYIFLTKKPVKKLS